MWNRRELCDVMYDAHRRLAHESAPRDVQALVERWHEAAGLAAMRGEASLTVDVTAEKAVPEAEARLARALLLVQDFSPDLRLADGKWVLTLVWAGVSVRTREAKL